MGIESLSSLRTMFAKADIFIAKMISKIYSLILQLADVNIVNQYVKDVIERVYGIIGLFMLFKLALIIINYIVDPEKQQAVGNIVKRTIIALVLIPTVPVVFEKAYELQGIILQNNIIGNIILGKPEQNEQGGGDEQGEMASISDEVSYLIFSNFLDYNTSGALELAFSDCPNIFLEPDNTTKTVGLNSYEYCCHGFLCPGMPKCGYYLYYPAQRDHIYGWPDEDGNYPDSRDVYYACKSGDVYSEFGKEHIKPIIFFDNWTHYCGIRDGKYIYDLINKGREEKSVSTILSMEIVTAIENDPMFYEGSKDKCLPADRQLNSDGDFVFDYNFLAATLSGIAVTFLLIIICVDIAIRTIKLAFLQVISPIPVISYIDVKDSKLFSGWVKESITTYLQLFIRLAVVFFSVLLFRWLSESVTNNTAIVNIFMIIGILLFTFQMPRLLCELFNLNKENGFLSLIKNAGKFAIGASAIGISTIGGTAANIAATPNNIRNVKPSFANASSSIKNLKYNLSQTSGLFGKLGVFKSTVKNVASAPFSILRIPGSIVAGGISSGAKTVKKLYDNKGVYNTGDVASSIRESSMNRESRMYGLIGLDQDDIKSEISALETRQANLQTSYEQGRDNLSFKLSSDSNSDDIKKAFEQEYESYAEYVSDMTAQGNSSHIISENKYNDYDELYSNQNDMEKEMDEIKERLKLLKARIKEK